MDLDGAHRQRGGAYEFMGVSVRAEESDDRLEEMKKIAAALEKGLADTRTIPPEEIIAALPPALLAGGNQDQLKQIIARYRQSLYPRSEEHTSELQSLMRISYAVFCLTKKSNNDPNNMS